jgi:hypothetical protein
MANTIRIKKRAASGSAGAPSSLAPSELAFNEHSSDLKLYYGFGDNGSGEASSIIAIGGSGAFFNKTDTRTANTILSGPTTGSAAAPTFRALVAADIPSVTHAKISDFDTGVQTNRLDQMAAPTSAVSANSQKITSLGAPTADTDAATKAYVDSTSEGLDVKDSVKIGTTANITLSGTQTIDGVAISADERVLVKDQSTASQNGIYLCKSGSWTRVDDMAAGADAAGSFVFIEQGTTLADTGWVCSSNKGSAVVGTNNLAFTQFSSAGITSAGDGLDRTGNVYSVDLKSNGGLVIESTELALDLGASSITGTLAVSKLTSVTSTAAELNILDGVTSTAAELNILDGVTSTAAELNILDGVTATTAELNLMDGGTSATSTTLATADRFVCNDAGTMKQVSLADLVTFMKDGSTSGFVVDGGTF